MAKLKKNAGKGQQTSLESFFGKPVTVKADVGKKGGKQRVKEVGGKLGGGKRVKKN